MSVLAQGRAWERSQNHVENVRTGRKHSVTVAGLADAIGFRREADNETAYARRYLRKG